MSATITTWGATTFLDTLFGGRQLAPTEFWVALCTADPGNQADGTMLAEPDPNDGYARTLLTNDAYGFNAADTGVITNAAGVYFPVASADWPTVTHYALCDEQTDGNLYLYGSFATPRMVVTGDIARIPPGLLNLSIGSLTAALVATF